MAPRLLSTALALSLVGWGASCASPDTSARSPVGPSPSAVEPSPPPPLRPSLEVPPASSSAPESSAEAPPSPSPAAPAEASRPFPPPPFSPPHPRTAKPGDGTWKQLEGAGPGEGALFKAVVHPHPVRWDVEVTLVAVDLDRVSLRMVAGTREPEGAGGSAERSGLVPEADQASLIAVFNGGFKARHGAFGMMTSGVTLLPPKPGACTVAVYRDESVRVGPWQALEPTSGEMLAFRQTPPCLVEGGQVNPEVLPSGRPKLWGLAEDGKLDVRRSALGLDRQGKTLFYAMGEWTTPADLAQALAAAGAFAAAELDINWSYTKFLLFGRPRPGAPLEVTGTLVPKMKHTQKGHVEKPADRDFFYLKRRP